MKANEAPEKIFLERILCTNEVYDNWKSQKTISDDIEYVRADAFIEKACKYLEPNVKIILCGDKIDTDKFIEDFVNYMKGE